MWYVSISIQRVHQPSTGSYMRGIAFASVLWLCNTILASAQEVPANIPVIGWLSPATTESYNQPGPGNPGLQLLRDSLAKHGFIDGKNIRLDMRLAEGKLDRLPGLAEALVREGASFRRRIGELSLRAKIPAICQFRNMVEAGCLASYGIAIDDIYVISADQIAKLLNGAKPADLPVQQPTRF